VEVPRLLRVADPIGRPGDEERRRRGDFGHVVDRFEARLHRALEGAPVARLPTTVVAFLQDVGADLPRTIMDHIERRIFDADSLRRLADTGINMEFDMFGFESSFFAQGRDVDHSGDAARLSAIRLLIDAGHLDQIVISQDICTKTRQTEYGGHGYGHIFRNILLSGYTGKLYPVAPGKSHIEGVKAYRYVVDIPDEVDLAVVVFPVGGSLVVSHANDSFFWIFTQFTNMDVRTGYRIWTTATLVLGVFMVFSIWVVYVIAT